MIKRKTTVKTSYPNNPMLNLMGSEPLETAMIALRELCYMEQSDSVKVAAIGALVSLARDASITIKDCNFFGEAPSAKKGKAK